MKFTESPALGPWEIRGVRLPSPYARRGGASVKGERTGASEPVVDGNGKRATLRREIGARPPPGALLPLPPRSGGAHPKADVLLRCILYYLRCSGSGL